MFELLSSVCGAQQAVEQQLTFVILSSFHGVCVVMLTSCMLVQLNAPEGLRSLWATFVQQSHEMTCSGLCLL